MQPYSVISDEIPSTDRKQNQHNSSSGVVTRQRQRRDPATIVIRDAHFFLVPRDSVSTLGYRYGICLASEGPKCQSVG